MYLVLNCIYPPGKLCAFFLNPSSDIIDAPSISLAIYHSQLLVVGGRLTQKMKHAIFNAKIQNKLWSSGDEGRTWRCSLPPMPTKHSWIIVANSGGNPECLIVAGGTTTNRPNNCFLVEVLQEGHWFTVQHLAAHTLQWYHNQIGER